jgi:hypothetical protein
MTHALITALITLDNRRVRHNSKRATFRNVALVFWLPDLDSNQGPAD